MSRSLDPREAWKSKTGPDPAKPPSSAVVLDKPPFSVPNVELFLDIKAPHTLYDDDERLRSFLIRMEPKDGV